MPGAVDRYAKLLRGRNRFEPPLPLVFWDDFYGTQVATLQAVDAPRGYYPQIGNQYTGGNNKGRLSNTDKVLRQAGQMDGTTDNSSCVAETSLANVVIVADMIHTVSDAAAAGAQIIFRYVSNTSCWRVSLFAASGGGISLLKHDTTTTVIKTAARPFKINTTYTVRVHAIGDNIDVFVDGQFMFSATNTFNNTATLHGFGGRRSNCKELWIMDASPNGASVARNFTDPIATDPLISVDATVANSMTQTAGGTIANDVGEVVQEWVNQVGYVKRNFRSGSGATQPTMQSDGSINVPKFNGTTYNAMWAYLFPETDWREWTYMAYVKTPTETDASAKPFMIKQGDYATAPNGNWIVELNWSAAASVWSLSDKKYSGTITTANTTGDPFGDDAYHVLTIVRKQTDGDNYLRMYVDSVLEASLTPNTWTAQTAGSDLGKINPQWATIGNKERSGGDDPTAWYFKRVKFWTYALTGTTLTDAETAIAA